MQFRIIPEEAFKTSRKIYKFMKIWNGAITDPKLIRGAVSNGIGFMLPMENNLGARKYLQKSI